MADKKITDLTLRSNVDGDINFAADDTIQTYRVTAPQVAAFALVQPRSIVFKNANYTLTDLDHVVSADATSSGFTLSLPTAVGRTGKIFRVVRSDSAFAHSVIIDPFSSETIDGSSTFTLYSKQAIEFISNNVGWQIISREPRFRSQVTLSGGNGMGSVATGTRRFTNTQVNTGTEISYVDDASDGATFTINEDGVYAISLTDGSVSAQVAACITKNSDDTSGALSISAGKILASFEIPSSRWSNCSWTGFLAAGDVIRAQGEPLINATTDFTVNFSITRIGA